LRSGFLEGFEQSIGGAGVGFFKTEEQGNTIASLVWCQVKTSLQFPNLIHFQCATDFFCLDDS
jgi:hypothetical protein